MFTGHLRAVLVWLPALVTASVLSLATAAEPARELVLRGVVKDRDGQPVAAAKVWAISANFLLGNDELDSSECDGGGQFTLTIPPRWQQGASLQQQVLG